METGCEMYRAVMEEVARFLDRYHTQKQRQRSLSNNMEQMSRSKSLYHVYDGSDATIEANSSCQNDMTVNSGDESMSSMYLRARSSTNLIDVQSKNKANTLSHLNVDDHQHKNIYEGTTNSYSAFKDFTWLVYYRFY